MGGNLMNKNELLKLIINSDIDEFDENLVKSLLESSNNEEELETVSSKDTGIKESCSFPDLVDMTVILIQKQYPHHLIWFLKQKQLIGNSLLGTMGNNTQTV